MVIKMEDRLKELAVKSIRKVVREHKDNCNSESCGVQTWLIATFIEEFINRPLTKEEIEDFM